MILENQKGKMQKKNKKQLEGNVSHHLKGNTGPEGVRRSTEGIVHAGIQCLEVVHVQVSLVHLMEWLYQTVTL